LVDSLPEAEQTRLELAIAEGKTNLAWYVLREAEQNFRLISEALEVLAARAGAELSCSMCGTRPAMTSDDYLFGPLCDQCTAKYVTWTCPDCSAYVSAPREKAGRPCSSCHTRHEWEALPQDVRDEIDRAIGEQSWIPALIRIRELTGCGLNEARKFHHLRHERQS
jgi:hypothetical protein